jgi:hypothetical protein
LENKPLPIGRNLVNIDIAPDYIIEPHRLACGSTVILNSFRIRVSEGYNKGDDKVNKKISHEKIIARKREILPYKLNFN